MFAATYKGCHCMCLETCSWGSGCVIGSIYSTRRRWVGVKLNKCRLLILYGLRLHTMSRLGDSQAGLPPPRYPAYLSCGQSVPCYYSSHPTSPTNPHQLTFTLSPSLGLPPPLTTVSAPTLHQPHLHLRRHEAFVMRAELAAFTRQLVQKFGKVCMHVLSYSVTPGVH